VRKLLIVGLAACAVMMAGTVSAHASTTQSIKRDGSPICFKYHFREYRDGVGTNSLLWRIDQTAYWCTDFHGHFLGGKPTVTRSHDTGDLWHWDGWTSVITARHKRNPNRYVFRIAAAVHSLLPLPFTDLREHNYPYVRQTIYPDPGQATWASSCGCHNLVTAPSK
jgi:hypothetical protein